KPPHSRAGSDRSLVTTVRELPRRDLEIQRGKKLYRLCARAGVRRIHDGQRHSYASYRIRPLKGNLPQLAEEMGNSPRERSSAVTNGTSRTERRMHGSIWWPCRLLGGGLHLYTKR